VAPRVAELRIYPVKGLRGAAHEEVRIAPWGLEGDRRWMIVNAAGGFLSQREHPNMAPIRAENTGTGIRLRAAPGNLADVPLPGADAEQLEVRIWHDTLAARAAGAAADGWLSEVLRTPCRLVYLSDTNNRLLDPKYARPGETVNFADGFPALLASLDSLANLNVHLAAPIPVERFRPSIVVEGAPAGEEDCWRRIRIGEAVFRVAKPCDRCVVTTIDPETGHRSDNSEPLRTLRRLRRDRNGGVMFGQNLVPEIPGRIGVGDKVEVIARGAPNVILALAGDAGL
jgi:uncharacterized protein YcbX